jgi:hypothetical protein
MASFMDVLIYLRPGASFANTNDTLADVRWDTPDVIPPTRQEFDAAFVALGNPVPKVVAAGAMIRALTQLGKLAAVDEAVAKADLLSQRLWARAASFPRSDPQVIAIATAIGMSSTDLDALYTLAATL